LRFDLLRVHTPDACDSEFRNYDPRTMNSPAATFQQIGNLRVSCGHLLPFGVSHVPGGVNFSIFSANATGCTLVLFKPDQEKPVAEIPFPKNYRLGHVWAMLVHDLEFENLEYGFRMEGPSSARDGHYFDSSKILLDPYAREVVGREEWMSQPKASHKPIFRSRVPVGAGLLEPNGLTHVPVSDLIIYEMHLR
jgi:glycogen operon protein